ncbi:MAG: 5'/3'-nucleotidase SurE [Bacteriovoracaceae bacterium]|jgi:5'-nucleotidase|nr:5'/3'-nucleotidase SurE [Bacteriovoracaceae bacterium]
MKILLTNDDGYKAKGIGFLYEKLSLNYMPVMVAPDRERSSCGHGLTLSKPLRINKLSDSIFSTTGLPADCVLLAIGQILKETPPQLVISGPNHGANLGQDKYYSGTMAAAREASFRGFPAISLSVVNYDKDNYEFEQCYIILNELIKHNIHTIVGEGVFLNLNFPNKKIDQIKGIRLGTCGYQNYTGEIFAKLDHRDKEYYWVGGNYVGHSNIEGSDGQLVADNYISVVIERTHASSDKNEKIREVIECINANLF